MRQNDQYKDYYAALGLSPDVDQKEIGKAYRRLIKEVHPDVSGGKSDPTVGRRVAELVEAWHILGDKARRAEYDQYRATKPGWRQPVADKAASDQPLPCIEFQPACLDFGRVKQGDIVTGYVTVINRGGPVVSLHKLDDGPEWLSTILPPNVDCTLHFPLTLTVRIDTTHLAAWRRYSAKVPIRVMGWSPQSSTVGVLNITLSVYDEEAPKLIARPAGWIIEPWEREGAPRSLLFHCAIANEGGGAVTGTLEAPKWAQVEPKRFGPLTDGHSSQRALVLVDRQVWQREGAHEGTLWISTAEGDGRKLSILVRERPDPKSDRRDLSSPYWITAAITAIGIGPALALVASLPTATWALLLAACLALPVLLDRLQRWIWYNVGIPDIATGWDLGPIGDRRRLLLIGAMWVTIGIVLGVTADTSQIGDLPSHVISLTCAAVWLLCWLTISIRDGRKRAVERWVDPIVPLLRPISAMATVAAWGLSTGIVFHHILGHWIWDAFEIGASIGWVFGVLVLFARSDALFPKWRSAVESTVWNAVPMLTAIYGFAVGLVAIEQIAPAPVIHTSGASLIELPVVSLAAAVAAAIAAVGLLTGFLVGVLTILPSSKWTGTVPCFRRYDRYLAAKITGWAEKVFEDYAFRRNSDRQFRDSDGRSPLIIHWRQLPASMLLIGSLTSAAVICAIANLILAVVAFLGIVIS